ncbi:uncharacterized protein LOC128955388 [Oppia nitens]|uniref:uncharacterized protein LOC128955388 n=1 Tax=Oppia nitens TaxID=1686743 RepID=UPI0023DC3F33|nr:uncharacterized protein LOC128955388 [Oppia nitens]
MTTGATTTTTLMIMMICPVKVRTTWFQSYTVPIESLRVEHNWLICRQMIVFAGNILSIFYGLMILIVAKWLHTEAQMSTSSPLSLSSSSSSSSSSTTTSTAGDDTHWDQLAKDIDSSASVGYCIIMLSTFACISLLIKSNFSVCLDYINDLEAKTSCGATNNKERQPTGAGTTTTTANNKHKKIVSSSRHILVSSSPSATFVDTVVDYTKKKMKLLRDCLMVSPIMTVNVILMISLMPAEFSIAKNGYSYCFANFAKIWSYRRRSDHFVLLMDLCLTVLFVSIILIQVCMIVYVGDLINSAIDKKQAARRLERRLRMGVGGADYADRPQSLIDDWHSRNRRQNLRTQRNKNILFHNFLRQHNNSNNNTTGALKTPSSPTTSFKEPIASYDRQRSLSRSPTIAIARADIHESSCGGGGGGGGGSQLNISTTSLSSSTTGQSGGAGGGYNKCNIYV